jgi:hypothetical protein
MAQLLDTLVTQFANLNPVVSEGIVVLAGLSGALLLGLAAWVKYKKVVADAQEQLIATGPAGEKAAGAIGMVSKAAGQVAGFAVLAEAISMVFDQIDKKSADADKLTSSIQNLIQTGKTAGELKNTFGEGFDNLNNIATIADGASHGWGKFSLSVDNSIPIIGSAAKSLSNLGERLSFGTDVDQSRASMEALDTALTSNITSLHDYTKASELWQQVLSKSGLDTEHLAALLPNTYKELGVLSAASEKGAAGMQGLGNKAAGSTGKLGDLNSALKVGADVENQYKTKADSVAGALRGQADAFISLSKQLRSETDPAFAFVSAQDAMTKAQKEATKAVKEHGRTSNEARAANHSLVTAALDLQEAAGRASSTLDGKLDPALVATLRQAGLTKSQINEVSKELQGAKRSADAYTGKYPANVSAPGATQAKKQLDDARTPRRSCFDGQYQIALTSDRSGQG